jgi:AcrR family transcriptional regulator
MADKEKKALTRKEREWDRHREEVLHAAERVFCRKGFHSSTMNDIAKEAEFGIGTIYNFFKSKEDIFYDFLEHKLGEMFATINLAIDDSNTGTGKVEAMIDSYIGYFQNNRELLNLFLAETPFMEWSMDKKRGTNLIEKYNKFFESMVGVFEYGMKSGEFEKSDPFKLVLFLIGSINGTIHSLGLAGQIENIGDLKISIKQTFFNGILKRNPK